MHSSQPLAVCLLFLCLMDVSPVHSHVLADQPATVPASEEANDAFDLISRLIGGEWLHESESQPGNVFRSRNIARFGPGERSLIVDGWLGNADGMFYHANTQIWVDHTTAHLRFSSVDQDGLLSTGTIALEEDEDDSLRWDWIVHTLDGPQRFDIIMRFDGAAAYTMLMRSRDDNDAAAVDAPAWRTAHFARSHDTPAAFLRPLGGELPAPGQDDPLEISRVVAASVDDLWAAWTTDEGLQACLVESSKIELRIGGAYEWYFSLQAPEGQRGSEQCTVLSYRPKQMLSFTWNAPPSFEHARFRHTWVVVTFEPVDMRHTRVTITHHGWAEQIEAHPDHAEEWRSVRTYFANAWPMVLGAMDAHFANAAAGR